MKHNLLRLGRKLKEVMHLLVHCRHGFTSLFDLGFLITDINIVCPSPFLD
jgi:hypothetical protein